MAKPSRTSKPRLPLSRERVLRGALDLVDRDGIESLSMRRLGRELGVEAMSLYNHVVDKDDMLDGLADIVVGEIEPPVMTDGWRPATRRWATSLHDMLTRHPWASGLMESRTTSSHARSRYQEAVVGGLRQAGFSIELAVHAFFTLDSYIYGFAVQERNMPSGTPEELAQLALLMRQALPATEYPFLNEAIVERVLTGFDYAEEFGFGLDLILDGFERARRSA